GSGAPGLWVVLRPTGREPPFELKTVTADPTEGEGFTEAGTDLVEQVPMPEPIRQVIAAFIAEHPVEHSFAKRERDRADPEALGRAAPGAAIPPSGTSSGFPRTPGISTRRTECRDFPRLRRIARASSWRSCSENRKRLRVQNRPFPPPTRSPPRAAGRAPNTR